MLIRELSESREVFFFKRGNTGLRLCTWGNDAYREGIINDAGERDSYRNHKVREMGIQSMPEILIIDRTGSHHP